MPSCVWRIRMRAGDYGDYTEQAWERGEVGVWYGAWNADDFRQPLDQAQPHELLSALPEQQKLGCLLNDDTFKQPRGLLTFRAMIGLLCPSSKRSISHGS